MRIAITGALGHIGSRLIRHLPEAIPGCEIVLINHDSAERYYPLFDLPDAGRYQFVSADVREADLSALFAGTQAVIHLACATRTRGGPPLSEETEERNVESTSRVARACAATGAALAYVSSASVYSTRKGYVDENCSPSELQPTSRYSRTKLREEAAIQAVKGLRFAIFRFGTIFGFSPGMRFDTAVNKFCWQATLGLPLSVWQTALEQKRAYLDVVDAARALTFFVDKNAFDNRIYNVLTTNTTVNQILGLIRRRIPDLQVEKVADARMTELSFDIGTERIRELGFRFEGDLQRGIDEVLHALRGIRPAARAQLRNAG